MDTDEQGGSWWGESELVDKFGSQISLDSSKNPNNLTHTRSMSSNTTTTSDRSQSQSASQILWSTGVLSEPIPNGFYSLVHVSTFTCCIMCNRIFFCFFSSFIMLMPIESMLLTVNSYFLSTPLMRMWTLTSYHRRFLLPIFLRA